MPSAALTAMHEAVTTVLALSGTDVQEHVRDAVDFCIPTVEAVGAAIILFGVVQAFLIYAATELRLRPVPCEDLRVRLGRFLALGLEFQLGADILSTAVSPTFDDLGKLAAIAAIRTALNYFLAKELEKGEEHERTARAERDGTRSWPLASPRT
jgi:uncharacterized membrane protein